MILHTVNRSPFNSTLLERALQQITPPAALLLIEEAVYAAESLHEALFDTLDSSIELYVLLPDAEARGIQTGTSSRFTPLSSEGFVELSLRCSSQQAWY